MLTLSDIASTWQAGRTRFGVTDLHIRGTVMEQVIAPEVLSRFNLLPHSSPGARRQEMFSFVISSRGHLTDSHSDAPDSSNFCFAGRKLWLAWDTYEGARYGLQDVERVPVKAAPASTWRAGYPSAARAGFWSIPVKPCSCRPT
jgi:hypothetical protein